MEGQLFLKDFASEAAKPCAVGLDVSSDQNKTDWNQIN